MTDMWLARDRDGTLTLFREKPEKVNWAGAWVVENDAAKSLFLDEDLYPEVTWEDSEPTAVKFVPCIRKFNDKRGANGINEEGGHTTPD